MTISSPGELIKMELKNEWRIEATLERKAAVMMLILGLRVERIDAGIELPSLLFVGEHLFRSCHIDEHFLVLGLLFLVGEIVRMIFGGQFSVLP